jgi:hypothetical protein
MESVSRIGRGSPPVLCSLLLVAGAVDAISGGTDPPGPPLDL